MLKKYTKVELKLLSGMFRMRTASLYDIRGPYLLTRYQIILLKQRKKDKQFTDDFWNITIEIFSLYHGANLSINF